MNFIKFAGRYAILKEIGFTLKKLYQNNIVYTTYETGGTSDIWIHKAGGYIRFEGYNYTTSTNVLVHLINNNFEMPKYGMAYEVNSNEIRVLDDGEYFGHIDSTGNWIRIHLKAGTIETLKKMWDYGWLEYRF